MYITFYFFIIGAFLGWVLEVVFKIITKKENKSAGILNGPFCILYGVGIMIISLFFKNITNIISLFILCTVIMSFLEYVTDIFLYRLYNVRLWDYSNRRLNLKGRICLDFSICWGILSVFYLKIIYPYLYNLYSCVKSSRLNKLILLLIILIMLDFIISSLKLLINKRQNDIYGV